MTYFPLHQTTCFFIPLVAPCKPLLITTEKKKNVYFDRYTPVDGKVGDEDVAYKLEISMVSDAMQPDDILHNYTGILKQ